MSPSKKTDQAHPALGQKFGNYVVKDVLGEGGMGEVFLAEHERLGRQVALKRLKDRFAKNRKAIKRFVDEAWAIGQIQHDNIVRVTDFVLGEQDVYYIMELLEGQTLAEELTASPPLEPARAVHLAGEVATALDAVHEKGFVHGDIKPSNIFLTRTDKGEERVKLLDFGIASLMGGEADAEDSTATALVTPVYMSPEQADRQPTQGAADLYSLGAVLYHMLVGEPPFEAATFAEYVYKHTQEPPPSPRKEAPPGQRLSEALDRTVLRCLEKKPADRFGTARALRDALKASPPQQTEATGAQKLLLGNDRTGIVTRLCGLSAAAALVVALLAWQVGPSHTAPRATQEPPGTRGAASPPNAQSPRPAPREKSVVLRLQSEPSRATVHRLSPAPQILGLTPLTLKHPPTTGPWRLQLRLEGYVLQTLEVSGATDVRRRVVLKAVPPPAVMTRPTLWGMQRPGRPRPMVRPRPVDPMGIIDPFRDGMKKGP